MMPQDVLVFIKGHGVRKPGAKCSEQEARGCCSRAVACSLDSARNCPLTAATELLLKGLQNWMEVIQLLNWGSAFTATRKHRVYRDENAWGGTKRKGVCRLLYDLSD
jgi:hypothetical protein